MDGCITKDCSIIALASGRVISLWDTLMASKDPVEVLSMPCKRASRTDDDVHFVRSVKFLETFDGTVFLMAATNSQIVVWRLPFTGGVVLLSVIPFECG